MRPFIIIFAFLTALGSSSLVFAEPQPPLEGVEGRVIQVTNKELVIDIGSKSGLKGKAKVEVYRLVEVKHPITKKKVQDRFPIGSVYLNQVGTNLSIVSNFGELSTTPKPGDYVVFQRQAAPKVEPKGKLATNPSDTPVLGHVDADPPETTALEIAFQRSLGEPLTGRIAIWERYLNSFPESKHAAVVDQELRWLRSQLVAVRSSRQEVLKEKNASAERAKTHGLTTIPFRAPIGHPIEVVSVFDVPQNVSEARAFARLEGEATFVEVPMKKMGDNSWGTTLPPRFSESPNNVEVNVESVRTDGQLERAEGAGIIAVYQPPQDPAPVQDRSRASLRSEYVNFKAGDQTDEYWRIESDYLYRLNLPYLAGFKVGAGVYSGSGASVSDLNNGEEPKDLSMGYGFAETRFDWGKYFGFSFALQLGNKRGDSDQGLQSSVGFRTAMRLGHWDQTRLEGGLSFTEGIGTESWIALDILEIPNIPMKAEVLVTNLPVGADFGVILNYGAGYEFNNGLTLLAHVGWNARTINHHGPGAGLSISTQW